MSLTLWTMDIADPDELATFAVDPTSGAKSFYTGYNNPAVVKGTHEAQRTFSPAKRQQLYYRSSPRPRTTRSWRSCTTRRTRTRSEQGARLLRVPDRQLPHGERLALQVAAPADESRDARW